MSHSSAHDTRTFTISIKQIIGSVIAGLALMGVSYLYGLGTNNAVQASQMATMQKQIDTKVDRNEFVQFVRSVDTLTAETRGLREEMQRTREELAAERGRRGR